MEKQANGNEKTPALTKAECSVFMNGPYNTYGQYMSLFFSFKNNKRVLLAYTRQKNKEYPAWVRKKQHSKIYEKMQAF